MARTFDSSELSSVFAVALTAFAFGNGDGWSATVDRDTLPLFFWELIAAANEQGNPELIHLVSGWVAVEDEAVTTGKPIRHVVKLACFTAGPAFVASGNGYAVAIDC